MSFNQSALIAVTGFALAGCNAQVKSDGGGGSGGAATSDVATTTSSASATGTSATTSSAASTSAGAATAGQFEAVFPPPECAVEEQGIAPMPTQADFEALVVGRWLLCTSESILGPQAKEQGIEILADGHWFKLAEVSPGVFERVTGFENQGIWQVFDTSAVNLPPNFWQLTLDGAGGGGGTVFPMFSITPRKMLIDDNIRKVVYAWHP